VRYGSRAAILFLQNGEKYIYIYIYIYVYIYNMYIYVCVYVYHMRGDKHSILDIMSNRLARNEVNNWYGIWYGMVHC
jgi:hypothetical protein